MKCRSSKEYVILQRSLSFISAHASWRPNVYRGDGRKIRKSRDNHNQSGGESDDLMEWLIANKAVSSGSDDIALYQRRRRKVVSTSAQSLLRWTAGCILRSELSYLAFFVLLLCYCLVPFILFCCWCSHTMALPPPPRQGNSSSPPPLDVVCRFLKLSNLHFMCLSLVFLFAFILSLKLRLLLLNTVACIMHHWPKPPGRRGYFCRQK